MPLRFCVTMTILASLLGFGGCSSGDYDGLGRVEGTVTLDGVPYVGALVTFKPVEGGRSSIGTTDQTGRYELTYIRTTRGAEVGDHRVAITTLPATEAPSAAPVAKLKEKLPPRYNLRSELVRTVSEGANICDFSLLSE